MPVNKEITSTCKLNDTIKAWCRIKQVHLHYIERYKSTSFQIHN